MKYSFLLRNLSFLLSILLINFLTQLHSKLSGRPQSPLFQPCPQCKVALVSLLRRIPPLIYLCLFSLCQRTYFTPHAFPTSYPTDLPEEINCQWILPTSNQTQHQPQPESDRWSMDLSNIPSKVDPSPLSAVVHRAQPSLLVSSSHPTSSFSHSLPVFPSSSFYSNNSQAVRPSHFTQAPQTIQTKDLTTKFLLQLRAKFLPKYNHSNVINQGPAEPCVSKSTLNPTIPTLPASLPSTVPAIRTKKNAQISSGPLQKGATIGFLLTKSSPDLGQSSFRYGLHPHSPHDIQVILASMLLNGTQNLRIKFDDKMDNFGLDALPFSLQSHNLKNFFSTQFQNKPHRLVLTSTTYGVRTPVVSFSLKTLISVMASFRVFTQKSHIATIPNNPFLFQSPLAAQKLLNSTEQKFVNWNSNIRHIILQKQFTQLGPFSLTQLTQFGPVYLTQLKYLLIAIAPGSQGADSH